jgi:hypothetical protein
MTKKDDDDIQDYVRPWADLTRNEILKLLNAFYTEEFSSEREIAFARVIQRALKEKNT